MVKIFRTSNVILPVILSAILCNCTKFKTDMWEDLDSKFVNLFLSSKFDSALVVAKEELGYAENKFSSNDVHVGRSLNNLAKIYLVQCNYPFAESLLIRSLPILEYYRFGLDEPLESFAAIYHAQGKYAQAESMYNRILLKNDSAGKDLGELAKLYYEQNKLEQAEVLYKRALENCQGSLYEDEQAVILANLADLFVYQNRYEEAETLCISALEIWANDNKSNSETDRLLNCFYDIFKNEPNLGGDSIGCNIPSAIKWLFSTPCLAVAYLYGQTSLAKSTLFNCIGKLFFIKHKRFNEAEKAFKGALLIREKMLGTQHLEVIRINENIKEMYLAVNRRAEADSLERYIKLLKTQNK